MRKCKSACSTHRTSHINSHSISSKLTDPFVKPLKKHHNYIFAQQVKPQCAIDQTSRQVSTTEDEAIPEAVFHLSPKVANLKNEDVLHQDHHQIANHLATVNHVEKAITIVSNVNSTIPNVLTVEEWATSAKFVATNEVSSHSTQRVNPIPSHHKTFQSCTRYQAQISICDSSSLSPVELLSPSSLIQGVRSR